MSAASPMRDRRTIITPEAFGVSPDLLGLQLASPTRRLDAILIDLVCIGILTLVTRNFAVVLGLVVTVALVRASARTIDLPGDVFDRARPIAVGCLGLFLGGVTLAVVGVVLVSRSDFVSTEFSDDSTDVFVNVGSRQLTIRAPGRAAGSTGPTALRDTDGARRGEASRSTRSNRRSTAT